MKNLFRALVIVPLMIVVVSMFCGCTTYKRAFVAVHDAIDEALSATNSPAVTAVTNAVPVTLPDATKPATGAGGYTIDVTGMTRQDPPYTGHQLEAIGNDMECGPDAPLNSHFRVLVRYVSHRDAYNIGMLARKGYIVTDPRKTVTPVDFKADGGVYKFIGFTIHERDLWRSDLSGKAGEPYTSEIKTWGVWEYYK
jgi:hypothetical protein